MRLLSSNFVHGNFIQDEMEDVVISKYITLHFSPQWQRVCLYILGIIVHSCGNILDLLYVFTWALKASVIYIRVAAIYISLDNSGTQPIGFIFCYTPYLLKEKIIQEVSFIAVTDKCQHDDFLPLFYEAHRNVCRVLFLFWYQSIILL